MRRVTLLVPVALFLVASLVASCGSDTNDGEDAAGSGSPTPSVTAPATTSVSPTAEPSTGPTDEAIRLLKGTWEGRLSEPGVARWALAVTIEECRSAGLCGEYSYRTESWYTTKRPAACGGTLEYVGIQGSSGTGSDGPFLFQEGDVWGRGGVGELGNPATVCGSPQMIFTPKPDGDGFYVNESDGMRTIDSGFVRLCADC